MKYLLFFLTLIMMTQVKGQQINVSSLASYEEKLDDVMEIIDKDYVKKKMEEVEEDYKRDPNELNQVRLGLIYHEVAMNLIFLDKTKIYSGYAKKSCEILTKLSKEHSTTPELRVFVESYLGSSLALMSAETRKLKFLSEAFKVFDEAVEKFGYLSPRPEFMRGSVAENLPWFIWKKRSFAKKDFDSIIRKQQEKGDYADFKIMSFSYWGWARANPGRKSRKQALAYLDKAIEIDPYYKAGRKRAEELKTKYSN